MYAIHYACENFLEKNTPASVACIAYQPIGQGNAGSFSRVEAPQGDHDEAEKWMLQQYFEFLRKNPEATFVHWNGNKADYGFAALAARYRYLIDEDAPYRVPEDRTFDLDDLVALEHGELYVGNPRLTKLARANGMTDRYARSGKEEAELFDRGEFGIIRRSTEEKVHWIAMLAEQLFAGALTTERSVGSLSFAGGQLDAVQTVATVARRSLDVYREFQSRHGGRPPLADEHDDQDFIRGLLRMFFDDIRSEDYVPSYAGGNARIDFFLPRERLAIELKHTRAGLNDKTLGEELLIDVGRYSARSDVRHLVCLVFDYDGRLRNPRGLEGDISRISTQEGTGVTVIILDR